MKQFDRTNRAVAKEFLHREDGRLFLASLPDPEAPFEPREELTLERASSMLAHMILTLQETFGKRISSLEQQVRKLSGSG